MKARTVLSDIAAFVAVGCLVALTGQRFLGPSVEVSTIGTEGMVEDWEGLVAGSRHSRGAAVPLIDIVTFIDFECPACKVFALDAEQKILEEYGKVVRLSTRHYPLGYHRMAEHTAKAAECAGQQGRFVELYDIFFEKQDSLGIKTIESYAEESGVADLTSFASCMASDDVVRLIAADRAAGDAAGAAGTPTVIVDGLRLSGSPSAAKLKMHIEDALESRPRS